MKRGRWKRLVIWGVIVALLSAAVFGTYPFLAVSAPTGAKTVAVEGWIPEDLMPEVKTEIERRGYTTIYTTGTVRPFSYYVGVWGAIEMTLEAPVEGTLTMNLSGIGGSGCLVISGADTLFRSTVSGDATVFTAEIPRPVDRLRLVSTSAYLPPSDLENIYVKYMRINGINVHRLVRSIDFINADGTRIPAWPTYAHAAAATLQQLGVPAERIIVAPALDGEVSRTLANAEGFAHRAAQDGVLKVDVISLGVHARRSRKMYRMACGERVVVGIISLRDPAAAPGEWWKNWRGWYKVMKEMAEVPLSTFFEAEDPTSQP